MYKEKLMIIVLLRLRVYDTTRVQDTDSILPSLGCIKSPYHLLTHNLPLAIVCYFLDSFHLLFSVYHHNMCAFSYKHIRTSINMLILCIVPLSIVGNVFSVDRKDSLGVWTRSNRMRSNVSRFPSRHIYFYFSTSTKELTTVST